MKKKQATSRPTSVNIRPQWREIIPVLLEIYTMGKPEGRREARQAFAELAIMLDALNEQHPEINLTVNGSFKYIK